MNLRNRFSGEQTTVTGVMSKDERSIWRLKKRLQDFQNIVYMHDLRVSFLTLTQSDKSLGDGYKWVTGIMQAMKKHVERAGSEFVYVAVLEIQPKRYRERGVLAPHWHIAIACSSYGMFPHAERGEEGRIKKIRNGSRVTWTWLLENVKQKLGMYFCCDAYSQNIYNYLAKYMAKGVELEKFRSKLGKRVRVFSSSRIPVKYQMTDGQRSEYARVMLNSPEMAELFCRREDSKIVFRAKEVENIRLIGETFMKKVRYPRISKIMGDWLVVEDAVKPSEVER